MTTGKGKVYMVGAGPGDPGLITLKAVDCLSRADTVVYDFLANPGLLAHVSPRAELIYVGKKGSDHTLAQQDINRLLVDLARSGKTVVRLKGGDPYIFGRGGEEAEVLYDAGLPFEVVPGVTSTIAAPAYAGIPLTHRDYTSNVGFITGHEDPTKPESTLDWDKIATGLGTLVFVMGVKNLDRISANLIRGGRAPSTPAALVRWGTTPDQYTLVGTLQNIAELAKKHSLTPPVVFVVGEVVKLREKLNWFEKLPLFGRRILVTRTRAQASRLTGQLTALGAGVIECPTIEITPPTDPEPMDRAIDDLAGFTWLILTSPNGVDYFFKRLFEKGKDARALARLKIAAIGPATAEKIGQFGLKADLMPTKFVAEGLIEAMKNQALDQQHILLARAETARAVLPEELAAAGAKVREVALYRTVAPEQMTIEATQAIKNRKIDLVTFTSSSTVENLVELLGDDPDRFKTLVPAAVIGPVTEETARQAGFSVAASAREYTIDGLVEAIKEYFSHDRVV